MFNSENVKQSLYKNYIYYGGRNNVETQFAVLCS